MTAFFLKALAGSWTYLFIADGKAELRDARPYVGLDTNQMEDRMKAELGPDIRIAGIGPAGEKCSLLSCIINDKWRAAARSGLGALMGSKRLKAVVVKGTGTIPVAQEEAARNLRQKTDCRRKEQPHLSALLGPGHLRRYRHVCRQRRITG